MLCARVMCVCVSVCLRVTFVRTAGHTITPPLLMEPELDVDVPSTPLEPPDDAGRPISCAAGSGNDEDRRLTRSTYTDKHTHADTHTPTRTHTHTLF
jgi:hypothetical protein